MLVRRALSGSLLAAALTLACTAQAPGAGTGAPDTTVQPGSAPATASPASGTQVVFLGTGTPLPDPDRSGPATAIVVNGAVYLFDAGPGIVRRATQAARKGIAALTSVNLRTTFLTHLHSDHTMGLPDLMLDAVGHGTRGAARALRPRGHARDGGRHSESLGRRHRQATARPPAGHAARLAGQRTRDPARADLQGRQRHRHRDSRGARRLERIRLSDRNGRQDHRDPRATPARARR